MKKQVIFLYDIETNKVIEVSDVRSITSEQFSDFSRKAKENLRSVIQKKKQEKEEEELKLNAKFKKLENKINDLEHAIAHLLGLTEYSEEKLREFIDWQEPVALEEESNEQEN